VIDLCTILRPSRAPAGSLMPLVKLLGERLIAAGGKAVTTREALGGASAVGLYFSASWCPPCRGFTPQLVESFTGSLQKKGLKCVLVSRDRDAESFSAYFSKMPWYALPYEDQTRNNDLGVRFGVQTIPNFTLVDPSGKTITTDARDEVVRDPQGENFPWRPPSVRDLAAGNPGRLNELPSIVCLCEAATSSQQGEIAAVMMNVASSFVPSHGGAGVEYGFFTASGGPLAARIRELCGLPVGGPPQLILMDIPDQGGFYLGPEGVDALEEEAVRKTLNDFEASRLSRHQLAPPS